MASLSSCRAVNLGGDQILSATGAFSSEAATPASAFRAEALAGEFFLPEVFSSQLPEE